MTYYVFIQDDKIDGQGQCKRLDEGVQNIVVEEEIYNDIEKYIYQDGEIVLNPNYEAEQAQKEAERVSKLTCTKRVFALMLQELGITYTMLKQLIATNEQAQLEWDLCVELERGNPLLDIMASQLGITSEQLDGLFKYANGEITIEEFRGLCVKTEEEGSPEEIVLPEDNTDQVEGELDMVEEEPA